MSVKKIMCTGLLVLLPQWAAAAGSHDGHNGHAAGAANDLDMSDMDMGSMDAGSAMGMASGGHGGHAHDYWVEPPAAYQSKTHAAWDSYELASAGMTIYRDNCMNCHGVDGRGTGPLAKNLEHPPADLTNHFHQAPGDGDQYLFWRVSKGGTVEPFASAHSAMPAFESLLNEQDRWRVLTYVHQVFHGGFAGEDSADAAPMAGHGHGGGHH